MPRQLGLLVVPILAALLCANTLNAPFVFDDVQNITANRHIRLTELAPASLWGAALESPAPRPVAYATFVPTTGWAGIRSWVGTRSTSRSTR